MAKRWSSRVRGWLRLGDGSGSSTRTSVNSPKWHLGRGSAQLMASSLTWVFPLSTSARHGAPSRDGPGRAVRRHYGGGDRGDVGWVVGRRAFLRAERRAAVTANRESGCG